MEITSRIFTATANFGGRLQVRCPADATPVEPDALKALADSKQQLSVVSCRLSPPARQLTTENRQRARSALFVQHFEGVVPLAGKDSVQHPGHAHRLEIAGALDAADVDDAPSEVLTNL